jgi:hypothetical protein
MATKKQMARAAAAGEELPGKPQSKKKKTSRGK